MRQCTTRHTFVFFFFNDTATTEIYTLSLHDALPIWDAVTCGGRPAGVGPSHGGGGGGGAAARPGGGARGLRQPVEPRSEEHTSELQSRQYLVCRLLLEKKKKNSIHYFNYSFFYSPV